MNVDRYLVCAPGIQRVQVQVCVINMYSHGFEHCKTVKHFISIAKCTGRGIIREEIEILGGWLKILSTCMLTGMYLKYFSVPPRKFTLGMYVVPKIYSFVSSTPVKLFSCL